MVIFDQSKDILLVSLGAALGANIRFIIYKKFEKLNISKYVSILTINSFASFLLGFFLPFVPKISYYDFSNQLLLFFSIGFLGSLSTFSTFVYDIFELTVKLKFFSALKLFAFSLALGIISLALGFFLVN